MLYFLSFKMHTEFKNTIIWKPRLWNWGNRANYHENPWSRPYHCVSRTLWMLFLCSQFLPFFVRLANSYSSLKRQLKYHLPCKNFLHSPTSVPFPKACFGPCVASNTAVGLHIGSLSLTTSPLSLRNGPAHFCNSSIWQRRHTGGTHAMLVGLKC